MHDTILCYIFCLYSNSVNLGRYIWCCKNKVSLNYPTCSMWHFIFYHSHYWELGWYRLLITVELFGIFCTIWEEVKESAAPFQREWFVSFSLTVWGREKRARCSGCMDSNGSLWECQSGDPQTHHRWREHTRQRHRGPEKDCQWAT